MTAIGATLSFAMGSAKVGNPYPQLSFHLRGGLSAMGQSEKSCRHFSTAGLPSTAEMLAEV
jgi:hypothetical protein